MGSLNDVLRKEAHRSPPRLVLVGSKKVGKSSFAAGAPDVVFIPTEKGADALDVAKLIPPGRPRCETWDDVLGMAKLLLSCEHKFRWVCIDTADEAVQFCAAHVCARDFGGRWVTKKGTEGFDSYGKGEKAVVQEFRQLLGLLDEMQEKLAMGVILLSHDALHKQGNAFGADFYKLGGSLGKVWPLVADWADQLGFATQDVRVCVRDGEVRAKAQAISRERYIIFEGGPELDAGARAGYEMPPRVLLSWDDYAQHLGAGHDAEYSEALAKQAAELLAGPISSDARKKFESKLAAAGLGGKPTDEALRALGKARLESAINWLMSQQQQTTHNTEAA